MNLGDVVDVEEVSGLRRELSELRTEKTDFEKRISTLVDQKRESGEKIVTLLAENSKMVSECDSLGADVKNLQSELAEVKRCSVVAKEKHAAELKTLSSEKIGLQARLEEMEEELAKVQAESFNSFEEGYGVCLARFSASGIEVEKHTFSAYLEDLHAKLARDGSGSSNHPANEGV